MEKIVFAFIHLGLPLLIFTDFILRKSRSNIGLITRTILYVAILYFLFLWGQWPLVGSYYFRVVVLLFIALLIGITIVRFKSGKFGRPRSIWQKIAIGLTTILALFVLTMDFNAIMGRFYPGEAIELAFPLKGGTYYVSSGGSKKVINNHIRDFPSSQHYAMDINQLGKFGEASKKFMSSKNTDHYIFSDTVYCPCNGIILETKTSVKDNESSSMNVNAEDGTGNFVEIKCDSIYVFIPHFKQHSIFVYKDLRVKQGSPLGLVGISGFSQEPHLHIQAAGYNKDSVMTGIPIKFNGKMLSRNNLYAN